MDTNSYEEKVGVMLSDERTYGKLKTDPTTKYKKTLTNSLTRLKEEGKLTFEQFKHLCPTTQNEIIPRMYCTPKIHKQGNPLRPIVDYTGSIGYKVSRYLADILGPLVGKTKHHAQNSKDLADEVKDLHLDEDEMFCSHDVVSLFTNTPT